jgi:hypothetical protein
MLFYWLTVGIRKLLWLFRPPSPRDIANINPNAPCPVCGARSGRLRCVVLAGPGPQSKDIPERSLTVMCQHSCKRCGGRWFERTVVRVTAADVLPSVARNKIESSEDRVRQLEQAT